MLLEELLKTTPVQHPDHQLLNKAFQNMLHVATSVNESIRQHEMFIKMLEIQTSISGFMEPLLVPGRTFIKKGSVFKISRSKTQVRHLFLFNDMMLYTGAGFTEGQFVFHRRIDLKTCRTIDILDDDSKK